MNNERRILPLRKYTVSFEDGRTMTFTADSMRYDKEEATYYFYSTGNVIRLIRAFGVEQIVVTPVDDAEVPE